MNFKPMLIAAVLITGVTMVSPDRLMADKALSPEQAEAVKKLVRETIINNPSIIREALVELEKRQMAEQENQQRDGIAKHAKNIFRAENALVSGNDKGDVTVVEFFDYNCGYCRRAMKHVTKLIDSDKNVRVVFKELPIFGEKSEEAAKAAIAARKQGKYFELHQALMEKPGTADMAKALRLAKDLGLDVDQLRKDMKDPSVQKQIDDTKELANQLGIQGTPFYLVGDNVIPGAPDDLFDQLTQDVTDIRKNGCKAAC